jgi:hypothetical protein
MGVAVVDVKSCVAFWGIHAFPNGNSGN